jgi:hypothetical protein
MNQSHYINEISSKFLDDQASAVSVRTPTNSNFKDL